MVFYTLYAAVFLTGLLASYLGFRLCNNFAIRIGLIDDPGHRKIHNTPIPLSGGLTVFFGIALPVLIGAGAVLIMPEHWEFVRQLHYGVAKRAVPLATIVVAGLGMLLVGLIDDRFELKPSYKFAGQLLFAFLLAASGVRITLFVHNVLFSYAVTIFWVLALINAFNFMDNMNGLCSGLALIGALGFGILAAAFGQYLVALFVFLSAGALAGFLPRNFPKAQAFLGDSGSHFLGFLLAVLAILPHYFSSKHPKYLAVLVPLFILAVPLLDMVYVVLLRWRLGQPFYIGDNNHLSHRLVRKGLSKSRAVAYIWLMAVAIACLSAIPFLV